MDNNTNNINDNGNLDNQAPKNQKGFMSKASDFIDDYRNAGSLKTMAQKYYEENVGSREAFREEFGKSFILEEE